MTPEEKAAKEAAEKKAAEDKAAADKKAADDAAAARSSQDKKRQLERKKMTAARLIKEIHAETGEDITTIAETNTDDDDNQPITKGDFKRMERENAAQTARQLANEITDETERNLVLDALDNTIVPSGNPQKDLQKARDLANSEKNRQIAEEVTRKRNAQSRGSGGGAPANPADHFEATAIELRAAKIVGKKTDAEIKEFILKVRAKEEARQR